MACLARLTAVKPSFVKKQQNICETWQVYTHNQQNVQTPSKLFFSMLFDIFSLSYIFILSFILIHSHNSVHLAVSVIILGFLHENMHLSQNAIRRT